MAAMKRCRAAGAVADASGEGSRGAAEGVEGGQGAHREAGEGAAAEPGPPKCAATTSPAGSGDPPRAAPTGTVISGKEARCTRRARPEERCARYTTCTPAGAYAGGFGGGALVPRADSKRSRASTSLRNISAVPPVRVALSSRRGETRRSRRPWCSFPGSGASSAIAAARGICSAGGTPPAAAP